MVIVVVVVTAGCNGEQYLKEGRKEGEALPE